MSSTTSTAAIWSIPLRHRRAPARFASNCPLRASTPIHPHTTTTPPPSTTTQPIPPTTHATPLNSHVLPVHTPPTGTPFPKTIAEDGRQTSAPGDFGFVDTHDTGAAATFPKLNITTLPTNGSIKLNGVTQAAGASITV